MASDQANKTGKHHTPQPVGTQLRVARLLKAHGLKGAIKLELYTDDPDGRFVPGATFTLQVPSRRPGTADPSPCASSNG